MRETIQSSSRRQLPVKRETSEMSGISGPRNSNSNVGYSAEYTQEQTQDRNAPEEAQTQASTTQQRAEARYEASEFIYGENLSADPPPNFSLNPHEGEGTIESSLRPRQTAAQTVALARSPRSGTRPPMYGEHINTPAENPANDPALRPRPSTSSLRRIINRQPSQGTIRTQASIASFQSNAFDSRANLPGRQDSSDVPPVHPSPLP